MSYTSALQIIVLEDRPEYIRDLPPGKAEQMEREPFELRVICNPSLRAMDQSGARFYEGCLSVQDIRCTSLQSLNHRLTKFQAFSCRMSLYEEAGLDTEAVGGLHCSATGTQAHWFIKTCIIKGLLERSISNFKV